MRTTLFSITLNLKNTAEMEIVQDAVALIMQRREHEAEERRKMYELMALDEKGNEPKVAEGESYTVLSRQFPPAAAPVTPSTPVAPPAASPVAVKTDIEAALRAYSEQHGLAAARKLLTEEGIDRIGSATPAQKASLAARLEGLLAVAAA